MAWEPHLPSAFHLEVPICRAIGLPRRLQLHRPTSGALPYVQEALQWLPSFQANEPSFLRDSANQDLTVLFEEPETKPTRFARVFLVDDNRDIREYIERLLARNYEVTSARRWGAGAGSDI